MGEYIGAMQTMDRCEFRLYLDSAPRSLYYPDISTLYLEISVPVHLQPGFEYALGSLDLEGRYWMPILSRPMGSASLQGFSAFFDHLPAFLEKHGISISQQEVALLHQQAFAILSQQKGEGLSLN